MTTKTSFFVLVFITFFLENEEQTSGKNYDLKNYDLNWETAEFLELGLCDFGETLFSERH